jgi:hypothetical protein
MSAALSQSSRIALTHTGMGPVRMCAAAFQTQFGMASMQYIKLKRLNEVSRLLKSHLPERPVAANVS